MPVATSQAPHSAQTARAAASSSTSANTNAEFTSHRPVRLSVAHRELTSDRTSLSNVEGQAGPSESRSAPALQTGEDADSTLRRAAVRKLQLQRRAQRWMDKLMEETVDRDTFKKATTQFTPAQYLEITHERHLNSLCSYPLCPNPPLRPYSTAKRFIISTKARTIKPSEGNSEDGYCSKRCKVRSSWVERRLSDEALWLRVQVLEFDLLEDFEERGEFTWNDDQDSKSTKTKMKSKVDISQPQLEKNRLQAIPSAALISVKSTTPSTPTPTPTLQPAIPPTPTNPVTALIASLAIHERPTPTNPPAAPSLTSSPIKNRPSTSSLNIARPQPQPSVRHSTTPSKEVASSRDARRQASSAMMPSSTSQLASTIVSSTKSVGPIHQEVDSDEEREESDWEKDMAWGQGEEDEETKALFEEARLARELLEEQDA